MHRPLRAVTALPLLLLAACGGDPGPSSGDGPVAVGSAYPFAYVLERVGGDRAEVVDLTPPGAEPHDVELTARQVGTVQSADVVLQVAGFQPAVDEAVGGASGTVLDAADLEGVGPLRVVDGARDPHVWLDPVRVAALAEAVHDALREADRDGSLDYRRGLGGLRHDLEELDEQYRERLAPCRGRTLLTEHDAFGYLAERYGLETVAVAGLDDEAEPSPGAVADAVRAGRAAGVTTVFAESEEAGPAATVARELGARTAVLETAESVADGDDYLSVMRRNLDALTTGLGCA